MHNYDDIFIWGGPLEEGKALGTAAPSELTLNRTEDEGEVDPAELARRRKIGQTVGKRRLDQTKRRVEAALSTYVEAFQDHGMGDGDFRGNVVSFMKDAWRTVFQAGLRAGGVLGEGAGKGKELVDLDGEDQNWLKSAMQHEMRFLNKFVQDVTNESYRMPLPQRIRMYADSLDSFYDSARVIGLPDNVLIWWTGPNDKSTCESCRYLFENSPYTKLILPTSPRAGMTLCLTNCRDKLMIRKAKPEQIESVREHSATTRGGHISRLRRIKREGRL